MLLLKQYFEEILNISSEKSSIKLITNLCISTANDIQYRSVAKCSIPVIHTLYAIKHSLGQVGLAPTGMV